MNQMFSQAGLKCVASHNMESIDGKDKKHGSMNTHTKGTGRKQEGD